MKYSAVAIALLLTLSPVSAGNELVGDSIELLELRASMYGAKLVVEKPSPEELDRIIRERGELPTKGEVLILWNAESAVFVVAREGIVAYSSNPMSRSEVEEILGRNPT